MGTDFSKIKHTLKQIVDEPQRVNAAANTWLHVNFKLKYDYTGRTYVGKLADLGAQLELEEAQL